MTKLPRRTTHTNAVLTDDLMEHDSPSTTHLTFGVVRIALIEDSPYTIRLPWNASSMPQPTTINATTLAQWTGWCGELLKLVAQAAKLQVEIVEPPDGDDTTYGAYNTTTSTWCGMLGMLQRREVDAAGCDFLMSDDRVRDFTFTRETDTTRLLPIISHNHKHHHARHMSNVSTIDSSVNDPVFGWSDFGPLTQPFQSLTWLVLLICLVLSSAVMFITMWRTNVESLWLAKKIRAIRERQPHRVKRPLPNLTAAKSMIKEDRQLALVERYAKKSRNSKSSLFVVAIEILLAILLNRDSQIPLLDRLDIGSRVSTRMLLAGWALAGTLISSLYSAQLVVLTTVRPVPTFPVHNFQSMQRQGYRILIERDSAEMTTLQELESSLTSSGQQDERQALHELLTDAQRQRWPAAGRELVNLALDTSKKLIIFSGDYLIDTFQTRHCELEVLEPFEHTFPLKTAAFAMRRHSDRDQSEDAVRTRALMGRFDVALNVIRYRGLGSYLDDRLTYWQSKYANVSYVNAKWCKNYIQHKDENDQPIATDTSVVRLRTLKGPFWVLVGGAVIGCSCLLLETFFKWCYSPALFQRCAKKMGLKNFNRPKTSQIVPAK